MISESVLASNHNKPHSSYISNYTQNITFVEAGITFSIFQSGEFDFFINRRQSMNTNVGYNTLNISYNSGFNYEPFLQYDDFGAVIQIEQIPIYYDYYGRAVRIGSVAINYHKNRINRVGGLHLYYNNYQTYYYSGFINRYNRNYYNHPYHNYFLRPNYNNCIVSYSPYRKHYRVNRHHYVMKDVKYKNNVPKHHKRYKEINGKIRSNSKERNVSSNRVASSRNNTMSPLENRNLNSNKNNSIRRNLKKTTIDRSKKEFGRAYSLEHDTAKPKGTRTEKRGHLNYESSSNSLASNSSRNRSVPSQSPRYRSEKKEVNVKSKRTNSKYNRSK